MQKIGVTACFRYADLNRNVFGPKILTYMERDMSRYLTREGVLPIMIPDVEEELLYPILEQFEGFVFQGGDDLSPLTYGEQPLQPGRWLGDPHRDAYELRIMKYAVENNKPIFGICRGSQLMNAFFGGTLYQDTESQVKGIEGHRHPTLYDQVNHPVELTAGKWLEEIYRDGLGTHVNSVHHQSLKDLGEGLEVLATAPDGTIEAIGWTGAPNGKVFAVQWHPEFFYNFRGEATLLDAEVLYDQFLAHCK